jgi:hypothetical protein
MTTATRAGAEVMRLENLYRDAIIGGDMNTVARLSADPCIVTGGMGVREVARKDLAQLMRESGFELKSYDVDEGSVYVRALSDDVVSVAYRVKERYERGGKDLTTDSYNSSMWVKSGGDWECAVHTESLVSK